MAVLFISEYAEQARDLRGYLVAAGQEPTLAEQQVAIGGSSTQSAALNAKTAFVRVHTDAVCYVAFGTNPTASSSQKRLAANSTEFFGVPAGKAFKVAVIQGV
jgi:hypothetical protein